MDRRKPTNFKIEDLLTVEDLALLRNVPEGIIIQWCLSGRIPYYLNSENEFIFDINEIRESLKITYFKK